MSIDEFDTPPHLAAQMVEIAEKLGEDAPRTIADFAVGTGELLLAAEFRWPEAKVFGCDISRERIDRLSMAKPGWTVGQCNFLDSTDRNTLAELVALKAEVDLVLLNPPFSARGGTRTKLSIGGQQLSCSPALAFVLQAVKYLSSHGSLVSLLPVSSLFSEKDQTARHTLNQLGYFQAINGSTAKFPGGNSQVTIVYFKRDTAARNHSVASLPRAHDNEPKVKVLRGTLPNRQGDVKWCGTTVPLVHSTELQGFKLQRAPKNAPSGTRSISGPAVLLHRVGKPRQDKVVYVPEGPPFAITDCVIALLCKNETECLRLHKTLTAHFELLERSYIGSGAPYITMKRIQTILNDLEFGCEVTSWAEVLSNPKLGGKSRNGL